VHSSQQDTGGTLGTVPRRDRKLTLHSSQYTVHWVQLQSGTVGTHLAQAQFPIETRNTLGIVPSRNRKHT
jgi:hypothetical protein